MSTGLEVGEKAAQILTPSLNLRLEQATCLLQAAPPDSSLKQEKGRHVFGYTLPGGGGAMQTHSA